MRFTVYLRLPSEDDICFLCICVQNTSVPLSLLGIWRKVGEAEFIRTVTPGDKMTVVLESNYLRVESHLGETKFHHIEVPEDDQSVAKTIKCQMLQMAELNKSPFGKLIIRKHSSNSIFQTIFEVKLDLNFESSFLKRGSSWTVESLYDLASLYGYLHSPFRWHRFAELLGFTSKEIHEINETLSQTEYYVNDSTISEPNLMTPRRIFCLLLSKFQKFGGCLSQVASILYTASRNKNKIPDNLSQPNKYLNDFKMFSDCYHHNHPKSDTYFNDNESSVSERICQPQKITHGICHPNQLNQNINFPITEQYNHVETHYGSGDDHYQPKQIINESRRKIFRNGSLDRMMNLKKPWSRHVRRRNSLPTTDQLNDPNHIITLPTFKLANEFDNFIEFGTPIKRASSYLNSDEEISQITPHKKQCTNNNNNNIEIRQQKYESIRKPKIITKRRADKNLHQQRRSNQALLPNLWHPSISSTTDNTTKHILNVVNAKIEETKRETEAIHKNMISFLEKIQSPVKNLPNFTEYNQKAKETNSLFLFSDRSIQDNDIWDIIHLCNNNTNAPNWKSWLKICHPTYNELNHSDQNWSKVLNFNKIDQRYTSYLILLNWIEINSNPETNIKPTYMNLFKQLIHEGYNEFVILCKQKLFNINSCKRNFIG
uniref:SH2 domain-containing protein n=1 Tax=Schistosoma mansoni TaxID=6183 RepID=A0A3Q0KNT1_SCHMA